MRNISEACYELLGIPPAEQPANYYRLLGLALLESNAQVIQNAADCRMAYVRQLASGPFSKISQQLLNLLAEARLCLLCPKRREQYNQQLLLTGPEICDDREAPNPASDAGAAAHGPGESLLHLPALLPDPSGDSGSQLERSAPPVRVNVPPASRSRPARPSGVTARTAAAVCMEQPVAEAGQQWVVGAGAECDVVINSPYVSRRHCRLTKIGERYLLEDLGSRNGTFVNGQWLASSIVVTRGDGISLGAAAELPWSRVVDAGCVGDVPRKLAIGRALNNDVVIPDPTVSLHHALLRRQGEEALLIDLGSTNGTYLDDSRRRIDYALLRRVGFVRFGAVHMPVGTLIGSER